MTEDNRPEPPSTGDERESVPAFTYGPNLPL